MLIFVRFSNVQVLLRASTTIPCPLRIIIIKANRLPISGSLQSFGFIFYLVWSNDHIALNRSDDNSDSVCRAVDHLAIADVDTAVVITCTNVARLGIA